MFWLLWTSFALDKYGIKEISVINQMSPCRRTWCISVQCCWQRLIKLITNICEVAKQSTVHEKNFPDWRDAVDVVSVTGPQHPCSESFFFKYVYSVLFDRVLVCSWICTVSYAGWRQWLKYYKMLHRQISRFLTVFACLHLSVFPVLNVIGYQQC